jgi:hypothetical protein
MHAILDPPLSAPGRCTMRLSIYQVPSPLSDLEHPQYWGSWSCCQRRAGLQVLRLMQEIQERKLGLSGRRLPVNAATSSNSWWRAVPSRLFASLVLSGSAIPRRVAHSENAPATCGPYLPVRSAPDPMPIRRPRSSHPFSCGVFS